MFHELGLTNEADASCNKDAASLDSTNNIHYRCCDIHKAPRARDGHFATESRGSRHRGAAKQPLLDMNLLYDTFNKAL